MAPGRRYLLIVRAVVCSGHHLLLVRHLAPGRAISPGRWHLPGGEVLEGESPQRAVERLVKHRSGLAVEVRCCLDAVARRGLDPATGRPASLLHLYFLCRLAGSHPVELLPGSGGALAPTLGEEEAEEAAEEEDGEAPLPGRAPGGPAGVAGWGWTDLASGLRALKHDITGPAVVRYLAQGLDGGCSGAESSGAERSHH